MSYRQPNTGDSVQDYLINLVTFNNVAHHLLEAQSEESFEIWLEKLELIDRRTLFLYLKKHKSEIRPEFLKEAQRRFLKEI